MADTSSVYCPAFRRRTAIRAMPVFWSRTAGPPCKAATAEQPRLTAGIVTWASSRCHERVGLRGGSPLASRVSMIQVEALAVVYPTGTHALAPTTLAFARGRFT